MQLKVEIKQAIFNWRWYMDFTFKISSSFSLHILESEWIEYLEKMWKIESSSAVDIIARIVECVWEIVGIARMIRMAMCCHNVMHIYRPYIQIGQRWNVESSIV